MKDIITKILTTATASLGGLGTYLAGKDLIGIGDIDAVNGAGTSMGAALVLILGAVLTHLLMLGSAKFFRAGKPGNDDGGKAGMHMLFALGTAAVAMGGLLPSCSSPLPITGSVSYLNPRTGAKAGLVFDPAAPPRARIAVPILDADTGEQVGFAELQTLHGKIAD